MILVLNKPDAKNVDFFSSKMPRGATGIWQLLTVEEASILVGINQVDFELSLKSAGRITTEKYLCIIWK